MRVSSSGRLDEGLEERGCELDDFGFFGGCPGFTTEDIGVDRYLKVLQKRVELGELADFLRELGKDSESMRIANVIRELHIEASHGTA
jgi:hypothetical protein